MPSTLSVTPTTGRSMLEEILEAIKLRDAKQKGVPPALPLRPALRGQVPSKWNTLPVKDEICEDADPEVTKATARPDMRANYEDAPENPVSSGPVRQWHGYSGRDDAEKVSSKDDHKLHASRLEVLEKQVECMNVELGAKEEKTVVLLQQVKDYERKWLLCEEKLKSMEEMYQKQIETFKVNIASVQKSFAAAESVGQSGKCDQFSYYHGYGAKAAVPADAPTRHLALETGMPTDMADICNVIYVLKNDSDNQTQVFEVDTRVLGEIKSGQSGCVSKSMEDLANLTGRYAGWKREYKMHLRETKAALEKLEQSEGGKPSRRWWRNWCCMKIESR